jgi:ribosomal protein S20
VPSHGSAAPRDGQGQAPEPAPAATSAVEAANSAGAGAYCDTFLKAFASALGVDESALGPAAASAAKVTIDAALAAGDLTQAQADRLEVRLKDAQAGGCPGFAARLGQAYPAADAIKEAVAAVASALGITPAELRTELKSGKDLKQLAAAKGVSYATVTTAALEPIKAALDAAVKAGTIKQARADRILTRLEANLADGRFRKERPAASATPGG